MPIILFARNTNFKMGLIMGKINIGVVGFSRRGKDIARSVNAAEDFNLICICDRDEERLNEAKEIYGNNIQTEKFFEEMIKRNKIDAIAIVTPQFVHRDLAVKAFEHGKHVFCEKPLALTIQECDDMIEASEDADKVFIVGQQMRYHLHLQKIASLIKQGEIGRPIMLWLKELRGPFRISPSHMWVIDKTRSGGALVEKCCHHFDMFNWFARSKPLRVYASGAQDVDHSFTGIKSSIIDNVWVIVDYENGVRAMLGLCMFLGRPSHKEGKIGMHRRDIGVIGDKGVIMTEGVLPAYNVEIRYADNRNVTRFELTATGCIPTKFNQPGNIGIFMDFAECIREGKKPFASGEIGREALAVSLAAEKSIEERQSVEIQEIYDNS